MNSAAIHSAKLIAEFEKQQQQDAEPVLEYPSKHPFGACEPGPFGGASVGTGHRDHKASPSDQRPQHTCSDAFAAENEMSNFAYWDAEYAGAPADRQETADGPAATTDMTAYTSTAAAGPSRGYHPRALTQYDYPGGWGAQTFNGVGGLTQDSASRVATLQAKLNQRLGPEYLSQRPGPGGGKKLTYIEGWKLVDLANEVFGFNGWSTTIVRLDVDFLDCSQDGTRFSAGVSCVVRVTLRDGAFHEDIGYGTVENARQKHAALEKGKKEAVTDATKRALKNFGKLLGNCTYDHQYAQNALKVGNPAPKFDASELHRRPELRPQQPPAPQVPPSVPQAAQAQQQKQPPAGAKPAQPTERPAQAVNGGDSASHRPARTIPPAMAAPQQPGTAPASAPVNPTRVSPTNESPKADKSDDGISERQQRSLLARQAYLERQQAESRKTTTHAAEAVTHRVLTSAAAASRSHAGHVEFGSDSFDDGLNDVLATYDETHAVDMEVEAQADDSGVAFNDEVTVKEEVMMTRRSASPVKQVKMEALKPRRAGSVGRFISPPPQPQPPVSAAAVGLRGGNGMRNGMTTLSIASGAKAPAVRRTTLLAGMGGVEGAVSREGVGKANGEPVNHGFVAMEGTTPRGVKRPSEAELVRPPLRS